MHDWKKNIDLKKLPKHIAVIMDGNGRWAKQQGNARIFGHENGVTSVRDIAEGCAELGIEYCTLYAFSTENWNRPKDEVDALMMLLVSTLKGELETLNKNNISLKAIGNLSSLPSSCYHELMETIEKTKHNTRLNLVLALSYSSYWEITEAVKKIASKVKDGNILIDEINPDTISNHLNTAQFPNPELMIRTSGEHRLSNYLLWQLAYAEFYFTEILWPDFRKKDLADAIFDYQNRERRFGKTGDQIAAEQAQ
jgi:undecaprenyl diphosphate synthase